MAKRSPMTANMWRVLKKIVSHGPACARELRCGVSTLVALELRGLIRVETTFNALLFPANAVAYPTDAGRNAVKRMTRSER